MPFFSTPSSPPKPDSTPRVWFITGASRGLGRALTTYILDHTRDYVVATARKPEALEPLARRYPKRTLPLPLDVDDTPTITQAVKTALEHYGRVDIVVNNAGYGLVGALEECSNEEIQAIFKTNVFGLIETTRALLPHFRERGSGHIINISSIVGVVATPGLLAYNATKFAVEGISESLALELESFGIKVSIVEPGPFRTDFTGPSLKRATPLPPYQDNPTTQVREFIEKTHNTQPGDPMAAARCIFELSLLSCPPLRLLLGNEAVDRAYTKVHTHLDSIQAYEPLSRSADFEDSPDPSPHPLAAFFKLT